MKKLIPLKYGVSIRRYGNISPVAYFARVVDAKALAQELANELGFAEWDVFDRSPIGGSTLWVEHKIKKGKRLINCEVPVLQTESPSIIKWMESRLKETFTMSSEARDRAARIGV